MISRQLGQQIRYLSAIGYSGRRIARTLGLSRNTVNRALAEETPPRYQRKSPSASVLEDFRSQIETGRRRGKTGVRLLEELQENGYTGSRSAFYRFLEQIDAKQKPAVCVRFETDPGEQAPVRQVSVSALLFWRERRGDRLLTAVRLYATHPYLSQPQRKLGSGL